jgi:hypothetical protein
MAGKCHEATFLDGLRAILGYRDRGWSGQTFFLDLAEKCKRAGRDRVDRLMKRGLDAKLFDWSDEIMRAVPAIGHRP